MFSKLLLKWWEDVTETTPPHVWRDSLNSLHQTDLCQLHRVVSAGGVHVKGSTQEVLPGSVVNFWLVFWLLGNIVIKHNYNLTTHEYHILFKMELFACISRSSRAHVLVPLIVSHCLFCFSMNPDDIFFVQKKAYFFYGYVFTKFEYWKWSY